MKNIIIGSEGKGSYGKNVIEYLIKKLIPNANIIWQNSSNCHFIVRSHFVNQEKIWNKFYMKKKPYLLWSGEAYNCSIPNEASKFLFMTTTFMNTPLLCYTPYVLYSPYLYKPKLSTDLNRPYLLAYCSSNKVEIRENLFNLFVARTHENQCHSLGQNFGKHPLTQRKVSGSWESHGLVKAYSNYKFVFALENKDTPGYVTEKIMNAFHSGAIPIYWGTSYVKNLFNHKAFIYVNDFPSLEACVGYVVNMSDEEREKMMNEPVYHPTNEIIHLMDDEFNKKNGNNTLNNYLKKMKYILS
jgi:hypothetical protein